MRKLTLLILSAGVFFSSILVFPLLPGGVGNLIHADLLFFIAIILTAFSLIKNPINIGNAAKNIYIALLLFVFFGFLSYVLAQFKFESNIGEIITVMNYLYGLLIALSVAINIETPTDLQIVLRGWISGALLMSLVSVVAILGVAPDWAYHHNRISSTMRTVNQVQSYLGPAMIMMLYVVYLRDSPIWKAISLFALPLVFVGMLATGSRTPIIIMAVIFCLAVFKAIRGFRSNPKLSSIILGIAGAFAFVLIDVLVSILAGQNTMLPERLFQPLNRMIRKFVLMSEEGDLVDSLGPRGEQIAMVITHWHENPFFGIGPGNFKHVMQHTHEVHSTYFGVLMEHGLVGFALFGFVIGLMLQALVRIGRVTLDYGRIGSLLLGALLIVLFYAASSFGIRQRTFWIMVGLTMGICKLDAFLRQQLGATSVLRHGARSVAE